MKLEDFHKSIRMSLIVIARFGFINKSLFFKHLTTENVSHKYYLWRTFLGSGLVQTYRRIGVAEDYYCLTRKGHIILREIGIRAVSKGHPLHFEHDEIAMGLVLACENKKLIKADWCPDKLIREMKTFEVQSRFGNNIDKIPDLIFNIDLLNGQSVSCAFEVERSKKSKQRYDSMVLNYSKDKNVSLIFVASNDRYISKSILQSIHKLGYSQSKKPFVFCSIDEIRKDPSRFQIEVGTNKISFEKYVENIRQLSSGKTQNLTTQNCGKNYAKIKGAA